MTLHSGMLLAYYSHTGNTREIAYQLHTIFDTGLHRISPHKPYPGQWNEILKRLSEDNSTQTPIKLSVDIDKIDDYHTILLGFPNWWNGLPLPVEHFLLQHDLKGKTILPFSTFRTNAGIAAENVRNTCPDAAVLNGLEVPDVLVKNARPLIWQWIRETAYFAKLKRRSFCACEQDQIIND